MERGNADVGSIQATLHKTPEIFQTVRVYVAAYIFSRMVHDQMDVFLFQAPIRMQFIGQNLSPRFNVFLYLALQSTALTVAHNHCANSATTLKDAEGNRLPAAIR